MGAPFLSSLESVCWGPPTAGPCRAPPLFSALGIRLRPLNLPPLPGPRIPSFSYETFVGHLLCVSLHSGCWVYRQD